MDQDRESRIAELHAAVAADPSNLDFIELAALLADEPESRAEAREICFRGLNNHATALRGRLVLARLFYLDGLMEFAARELAELSKYATVPALTKLLDAFGPHMKAYAPVSPQSSKDAAPKAAEDDDEGEVLAEIDLDAEFGEALVELSEDK